MAASPPAPTARVSSKSASNSGEAIGQGPPCSNCSRRKAGERRWAVTCRGRRLQVASGGCSQQRWQQGQAPQQQQQQADSNVRAAAGSCPLPPTCGTLGMTRGLARASWGSSAKVCPGVNW